jgi:hypothetical protein
VRQKQAEKENQQQAGGKTMTTFKALPNKSVFTRLDEASTAGKAKKTKNTAACTHSPFKSIAFVILAVFFVFFSLAGVASANEPWWNVMVGAQPSYLKAGQATDEVVSVALAEQREGEFGLRSGLEGGPKESFKWDATHAEVQTHLETLLGAGSVQVTGGPTVLGTGNTTAGSDKVTGVSASLGMFEVGQEVWLANVAPGTKIVKVEPGELTLSTTSFVEHAGVELDVRTPYVVTFTGEQGDQPHNLPINRLAPEGGEAHVTELTKGRPDANIVVNAANVGNADVNGETTPLEMSAKLPAGLRAVSILGYYGPGFENRLACELKTLTCTFAGTMLPNEQVEIQVGVIVEGARSSSESHENDEVTFTGGGAPTVHVAHPIVVSSTPVPYGLQDYEAKLESEGGAPDTQAGSHPYQFTTALDFNQNPVFSTAKAFPYAEPAQLAKNFSFELPPGLIGNPTPFPKCTLSQFLTIIVGSDLCPASTAVGVSLLVYFQTDIETTRAKVPLFAVEPAAGEPARFGFILESTPVFIDASVRSGEDYGVTAHVNNITQVVANLDSVVTFWGVPGEPSHDSSRGWTCVLYQECPPTSQNAPPALFTTPTSCNGELQFPVEGDSWQGFNERQAHGLPEQLAPLAEPARLSAMDGCNQEPFTPSIKVEPDVHSASSASGLNVDVHVPQESILNAEGIAQSNVKDISVTLPEGVQINPSDGDGLQACSEGLVGFTGKEKPPLEPGVEVPTFSPYIPGDIYTTKAISEGKLEQSKVGTFEPGVNFCADATKIGEVTIKSPLLPPTQPVKGFIYLATQNANPFGSLVALYLVAEDPVSGTVFKSAGETRLSATGQLTGVFETNPQLAFEDAELHFFGGERAPLATPAHCGAYTTTATLVPWSAEPWDEAAVTAHVSSTFNITSGPNGSACTYPGQALPFSPSLTGGSTNINAGSFTPLTTTIARADGNQDMQSVALHFPAGLSGLLSGVELCPEPQANQGLCGPGSLIGETTVSAGVGSDPVSVVGGKVFITGPYNGTGKCTPGEAGCAPFGLSVVNPVKAGPFDLEHDTSPEDPGYTPACDCVVVRAKVEVNPATAALTVTTNESGPYAIPHTIDGIPVQIQKVNVLINKPGFTFNPTNCNPTKITGSIGSDENAASPVEVPFQATNCAALKFAPSISFSTNGKTSKANGADLITKVTYPSAAQGTYANVGYVKVELPKALPSRLTTLQKACTNAQFELNPAGCPSASDIGHAVVHTPLLPVPLEGPAIFVSHGGEAFPSLTMVLQGYGVTIDLVGTTFISKSGITSTTFKTVPDQPFSTFELVLPQGPYSALAANGNLCTEQSSLKLPVEFHSQAGGAPLKQDPSVAVTGCKPAITVTHHSVKGKTATISVSVPSAGKLVATGKGLSKGSGKIGKGGTITVKLTLSKAEQAFLKKHHARRLRAKINLTFTPKKGGKLKTSTTVFIG